MIHASGRSLMGLLGGGSAELPQSEPEQGATADRGIVWTEEARRQVGNAPAFVRPGIWKLMERRACERGRSVITSAFLTEIRNESMLRVAKCIKGFGFEELSMEAFEVAKAKMRKLQQKVEVIEQIKVFLAARTQKNQMILAKFRRYIGMIPDRGLPWTEEAPARLQRAPALVRELAREAFEAEARRRGEKVVSPEVVEYAMGSIRAPDGTTAEEEGARSDEALQGVSMLWTAEAEERVRRIPIPAVRRMVVERVEVYARAQGLHVVDPALYEAGRLSGL